MRSGPDIHSIIPTDVPHCPPSAPTMWMVTGFGSLLLLGHFKDFVISNSMFSRGRFFYACGVFSFVEMMVIKTFVIWSSGIVYLNPIYIYPNPKILPQP